jgi:hypothetical protein
MLPIPNPKIEEKKYASNENKRYCPPPPLPSYCIDVKKEEKKM